MEMKLDFNINVTNMKTLGKLNINSEKIIKKEELVTLNGAGTCYCYDCSSYGQYLSIGSPTECAGACFELGCMSLWYW